MESVYNDNLHTVLTTPVAQQTVHATEMYQVVDMVKLYLVLYFQINWPNAVREAVKLRGMGQYMLRPVAAEVMTPAGSSDGFPWGFYTCRYSSRGLMVRLCTFKQWNSWVKWYASTLFQHLVAGQDGTRCTDSAERA